MSSTLRLAPLAALLPLTTRTPRVGRALLAASAVITAAVVIWRLQHKPQKRLVRVEPRPPPADVEVPWGE